MDLVYQIAAAAGGAVFASLVGGTNAFVFTGITGLAAVILSMAGGPTTFMSTVPGGPWFGPHVAFNSGVVALAVYKRFYDKNDEVDGTATTRPLYPLKPVVPLLAAAATGPVAYYLNFIFSNQLKLTIDTVALVIVISNVLTRLLIGKAGLFPKQKDNESVLKIPNEDLTFNIIVGAALGLLSGFATIATGQVLVGFYISAFSLVFISIGAPVTHHITLTAGYAAAATGNIFIAAIVGLIASVLGAYSDKALNSNADTLIDMPSLVIAILSFIIMTFI